MAINQFLTAEKAGIDIINDYAGAANDQARVQLLIDLIEPDSTQTYRGLLGDIAPAAQRQLLVELEALKASVT